MLYNVSSYLGFEALHGEISYSAFISLVILLAPSSFFCLSRRPKMLRAQFVYVQKASSRSWNRFMLICKLFCCVKQKMCLPLSSSMKLGPVYLFYLYLFQILVPLYSIPCISGDYFVFLSTVQKHNSRPDSIPIRSVLCSGLATSVGCMPPTKCAKQVRQAKSLLLCTFCIWPCFDKSDMGSNNWHDWGEESFQTKGL